MHVWHGAAALMQAPDMQEFGKGEREDIDFAIQEGIDIIRAVLALGMEKALSGCRVPR
jgi:PTH1 family peptidyl-tRNA hydrolase